MWRTVTAIMLVAASAAFAMERTGGPAARSPSHLVARSDDPDRLSTRSRRRTLDQLSIAEQSAGRPWSITRSNGALCFEVRQGERRQKASERDRPIERSEIAVREKLRFGAHYKFHYEFMVKPGPRSSAAWVNIGQVHSTEDPDDAKGIGPVFAVQFDRERMRIVARADPQRVSSARPPDLWLYKDGADLVRGRWYQMDFEMRIDPDGRGRAVVWRDGKKLVNYAGPLGYRDAVGPYWKLGIYRKTSPEPLTVCYRGFTLAETTGAPQATQ